MSDNVFLIEFLLNKLLTGKDNLSPLLLETGSIETI